MGYMKLKEKRASDALKKKRASASLAAPPGACDRRCADVEGKLTKEEWHEVIDFHPKINFANMKARGRARVM